MALRLALVLDGNAQGARTALQQTAADVDRLTAATVQQTAAAQANLVANTQAMRQSNGNVANLAAQFQDIGVTAAMGMSPLQIALQQGTQLSAVLGQQGAAGAAKMLAAALGSVLNPVSLITIAVVGFGAAALQALGSIVSGTDKATQSLEEHDKWLKEVLTGYDSAAKAAKAASEAAQQMPRGSVRSELDAQLTRDTEAYQGAVQALTAANIARNLTELDLYETASSKSSPAVIAQRDALVSMQKAIDNGNPSLSELHVQLTGLKNTAADEVIAQIAEEMLALVNAARDAEAQLKATAAAAASIYFQPSVAQFSRNMDAATAAIERMKARAPDLRSVYQQNEDDLKAALKAAPSDVVRYAAQKQFEDTKAALDAQKAQQEAKKSASAAKQVPEFDRSIAASRERTTATQLEIAMIGQSALASERARQVLELETAAKKDAIGLTPARIAAIEAEANASAQATTVLERQKSAWDIVRDTGSSSIDTLVTSVIGGTASMGDAIRGFVGELAKMALQLAVLNPIKNTLFGTNLGTAGDLGNVFSTLFGGKRETGGPVSAGRAYLVGEQRPEIFVPSSSGTILPDTSALSGGGGSSGRTVVNVIAAPGQSSTQSTRREGNTDIVEVIMGEIDQRLSDGRAGRGFASRYGLNLRTVRS